MELKIGFFFKVMLRGGKIWDFFNIRQYIVKQEVNVANNFFVLGLKSFLGCFELLRNFFENVM